MQNFFSLMPDTKHHPAATLSLTDDESGGDFFSCAAGERPPYKGAFVADDFVPKTIVGLDLLDSIFRIPVVSSRFKSAYEEAGFDDVQFDEARILFKNKDIFDYLDAADGKFWTAKPLRTIEVIDEKAKPMQFWPKLKRFKTEEFVITRMPETPFGLATDKRKPRLVICSSSLRQTFENAKLRVSFRDLPEALG